MTAAEPPGAQPPPNQYSAKWYEIFVDTIDDGQTAREVAFLARQLPLPTYRRVTDLCCGSGRHARLLAAQGYELIGVDANPAALKAARQRDGDAVTYVRADLRRLSSVEGSADAVVCLWQSFGYHSDAENTAILQQIAARLVDGGRFVLDVYNRDCFVNPDPSRSVSRGGETITQEFRFADGRLRVDLRYADGSADAFDWRLYSASELEQLCAKFGLRLILQCTEFAEERLPSAEQARMQLVFEKGEVRDEK